MITAHVPAAEYLEAIFEMEEEQIPTVQSRIAAWMGVSPASVSEAVKRLTRDGLVTVNQRIVRFTPEGAVVAATLVRRHRLAEHFLIQILGIPWHLAHEEAQRWDRVISPEVEERIAVMLNDPAVCPHGNPIPGSANEVNASATLPLSAERSVTDPRVIDGTLMERLGISWVETSHERVVATMPVQGNTQPYGALHGGATAALIESAASLGANLAAGENTAALGIDITVHHLRSVTAGVVTATATPLRTGSTISVWDVLVRDDNDRHIASGRCTLAIRPA